MFRTSLQAGILAISVMGAACGNDPMIDRMSPPAPVQTLAPGMAMLEGWVLDDAGQPFEGATVSMLDVPYGQTISARSNAEGFWSLTVPGDTEVALKVDATGFARSFSPTVKVAKGGRSSSMELMLLPTARIDALNALGGARVNDYAVIGVDLMSGDCDPEGGQLALPVMPNAKVLYNRQGSSMPDPALTSVQAGARPAAWIVGALPPGTYYQLRFTKAGCTQQAMPMEFEGRTYNGHLPLEAKAFSNGILFLQ